jgi:phosphatidylglycerol:prolipoprotein diacylglycerol transferase
VVISDYGLICYALAMFEAFAIGPAIIWTRLVFLLLGVWLAVEFFMRLASSAHLSLQHLQENAWRYFAAFLIGGRLIAILAEYRVYVREPLRMFIFWDGGFSFLGAAMGVAVVLYWATRTQRATFLQWLDVLLPATTFGLAFDWLGKFVAGRAYGTPTDVPWGVTYDAIAVRYTVPIHPVQLYYAFFFLLLTFLLLITRKYSHRAGSETFYGILLAGLATFLFEYFRGDFSIPVFATKLDFLVLLLLFISLGIFAAVELTLRKWGMVIYETLLIGVFGGYVLLRSHIALPTFELRFSQFLAVISVLAVTVYVLVHRQKYPHL